MPDQKTAELIMISDPTSPRAESFRVLRARLEEGSDRGIASLLITSPTAREKRHVVAANLALAFAESGRATLLVDADLHQPQLQEVFALNGESGLLQALRDEAPWQSLVQSVSVPNLQLLPAGGNYPVPAQLLGSKSFDDFLAATPGQVQMVILVGPPVLPVADSALLAPKADGVILVCTSYNTTRSAMREAKARLDGVKANIVGAVMDGADQASYGKY